MTSYDEALRQLNQAAERMGLDPDVRKILSQTASEITVNFPVKMDDGEVRMFTGHLAQHNNVLGPFAGGLRYQEAVDTDDVRALAIRMTWKHAVLGLPFGGAMGAVDVDPPRCSPAELERTTRRFTFGLGGNIGPEYGVLCPELGTDGQIMAWILDTYASTMSPHERNLCRHVVMGKPSTLGGSAGREQAAGQAIAIMLDEWARNEQMDLRQATFFIQGFGATGSWAARFLAERGARLLAVEDASGAIAHPDGIDPGDLDSFARQRGGIEGYPKASPADHAGFLSTRADIFIPASPQKPVSRDCASMLRVRVVAEGADSLTDREAEALLQERGIQILPDLLCHSGDTIVYYYEWLQNRRSERWEAEEVSSKMRRLLLSVYEEARGIASELHTDLRSAALIAGLRRIETAYLKRGIFP